MHRPLLLAAALLCAAAPARAQAPAAADTCPSDSQQSPINIHHTLRSAVPAVSTRYSVSANVQLTNLDSLEVKVLVPPGNASISLGGRVYELRQFHTHWPSEHRLDSIQFPAEIHFVHYGPADSVLAVGLFVNWSPVDNPAWIQLLDRIPAPGDTVLILGVRLRELYQAELLGREQVFHYRGSLTSTPYPPGVRWLVRERPLLLSSRQIGQLMAATGRYSRDLQRLCSIVRHPLPRR